MKFLPKLGIRGKILTSVTFFLIISFIIEAVFFYTLVLSGFKKVEEQDMVVDIQRVEGLIESEIYNYSVKIADWSSWDDSYNFIVDKNQAFIDSNLTGTSIANIKLNFMVFIASSGAIIEERGVNHETRDKIPIPKDLHELLSKPNIITAHKTLDSSFSGIVRLSSGYVLVVSKPILNSYSKGPIRGTLVFARYIDKEFLDEIALLERSKITIADYYSNSLPDDFKKAKALMKTKGVVYVEPDGDKDYYFINQENNKKIDGFTVVFDYNENPAFIIENELSRPFFDLGLSIVLTSLIIFVVVSFLSLVITMVMLNKIVISKIMKLKNDVNLVSDKNNQKQRLQIGGNDEFTIVSESINKMLDDIEKSEISLKESDDVLRTEKVKLDEKVKELEKFNQLTVDRELKMIELKKQIEALEAKK